jgi:hypothetical protein
MFYLDLIKNLVHHEMLGRPIDIQFVQLQRWLKRYEELGWIDSKTDDRVVTYRLRSSGVRGLLQALVAEDQWVEVPEALLLQQLLDAYGAFLQERLQSKRPGLIAKDPGIRNLLKPGIIFRSQIRLLDRMIANQEFRIKESLRLQAYCQAGLQQGLSTEEIAENMPSEFSYALSHQKPFRKLLEEIPEPLTNYEIRRGFGQRHQRFYEPYLHYLQMLRGFYADLLGPDIKE